VPASNPERDLCKTGELIGARSIAPRERPANLAEQCSALHGTSPFAEVSERIGITQPSVAGNELHWVHCILFGNPERDLCKNRSAELLLGLNVLFFENIFKIAGPRFPKKGTFAELSERVEYLTHSIPYISLINSSGPKLWRLSGVKP